MRKISLIFLLFSGALSLQANAQNFQKVRIDKIERNFSSPDIEENIEQMQQTIQDKELAWMFGNCFPNTIDRTVRFGMKNEKYDTFIITGGIPAMWLRDCSTQMWPFMQFMKEDKNLQNLIAGVINRQVSSSGNF